MTSPILPRASGLRVAVVGLGRMGMRHLQAVQRMEMVICGVADTSQEALVAARTTYGIDASACFSDAIEMLRRERPRALVVATTAPSHAAYVIAAAELGVSYVLCEKPMATSLAEADTMVAACRRAGMALAINHQMRFMPHYRRLKTFIGSEELGPLVSVIIAGSNFGLAMNAGHYFEMFRYLSGTTVRGVQAWLEPGQLANPRGPSFEDRSGRLIAWGEAGPPMYLDFSAGAGHGMQVICICHHGQIVADELSGDMRVVARKSEFRALPTTRYAMPADVRQLVIEPFDTVVPTMDVWSALLEDHSYPDAETGLHALACLVAAHVSHEADGCEVRLDDPTLPRDRRFSWA